MAEVDDPTVAYAPPPDQVKGWQSILAAQGLYQGQVTGVWDQATWTATMQWQAQHQVGQSGQLDMATKAKFGEDFGAYTGAQVDPLDAKVREMYGPGLAAYLATNPEVAGVLRQAASENWDTGRLQGALQATSWWKSTSDAARAWDQQNVTDPTQADSDRQKRSLEINQLAGRLGITLDPTTIGTITEDSLRMGMASSDLANVLTHFAIYSPTNASQGDLGANVEKLRQVASSYFLKPTDEELYDQSKRIIAGSLTMDGATATFQQQAKANFAYLAPQIDAGMTLTDYFANTKQRIAQTLEVNPSEVDLMNDSRFTPILNYHDPKTGEARAMTWGEQDQYLKSNYGDQTRGMQTGVADLAGVLRQTFTGAN